MVHAVEAIREKLKKYHLVKLMNVRESKFGVSSLYNLAFIPADVYHKEVVNYWKSTQTL